MTKERKNLQSGLDGLWTVKDVERLFRRTGMTIHNWRKHRKLPALVINGSSRDSRPAVRFIPDEVREWGRVNNVPMYQRKAKGAVQ